MIPFQTGTKITDKNQLFGREDQMRMLLNSAERHDNVGIIGSRRFGKTCLLQCAIYHIRKKIANIIPIYFDAHGIKHDTDIVYRKVIAMILKELCHRGIIPEGELELSRLIKINVFDDIDSNEEELSKLSSERQRSALEKIIKHIRDKEVYIICIFDEVEYLILEAFNEVRDFARFRVLSQDEESFKFWIAGSVSWDELCSKTGSPEFNGGLTPITLPPLSEKEFSAMWEHEASGINDTNLKQFILSIKDYAFSKSGGIPFYGKEIGKYICSINKEIIPDYSIVRSHLKALWQNRFIDETERNALTKIAQKDIEINDIVPDGIKSLEEKGIIVYLSNKYSLTFGYLKDYICAQNENLKTTTEICADTKVGESDVEIIERKVETIIHHRTEVNRIWKDREIWRLDRKDNRDYLPFIASDEDQKNFTIMKKPCRDLGDYYAFSGALYLLYYEGSKGGSNMPSGFNYKPRTWIINDSVSTFMQMVHVNRHNNGGHGNYSVQDNPMTPMHLYDIINNGRTPLDSDVTNMQIIMLDECIKELERMITYLNNRR